MPLREPTFGGVSGRHLRIKKIKGAKKTRKHRAKKGRHPRARKAKVHKVKQPARHVFHEQTGAGSIGGDHNGFGVGALPFAATDSGDASASAGAPRALLELTGLDGALGQRVGRERGVAQVAHNDQGQREQPRPAPGGNPRQFLSHPLPAPPLARLVVLGESVAGASRARKEEERSDMSEKTARYGRSSAPGRLRMLEAPSVADQAGDQGNQGAGVASAVGDSPLATAIRDAVVGWVALCVERVAVAVDIQPIAERLYEVSVHYDDEQRDEGIILRVRLEVERGLVMRVVIEPLRPA